MARNIGLSSAKQTFSVSSYLQASTMAEMRSFLIYHIPFNHHSQRCNLVTVSSLENDAYFQKQTHSLKEDLKRRLGVICDGT